MCIGHSACGDFLGHSVLSDKSAILRSPTTALTPSKLLVGSLGADEVKPVPRKNANLLKKPAVASPCTASLVFSSQSLECQIESHNLNSKQDTKISDSSNTESRPSRGAENRIQGGSSATADLKLERDKRGFPLDCQKSGDFFGVKGERRGINPFLRKENKETQSHTTLFYEKENMDSTPCHTKLCEVSRIESKRDFSPFLKAQNDKSLKSQVESTIQNKDTSATPQNNKGLKSHADSYSHIALIHFNF